MNRHPLDATALIFGLLFTLSGFAIVSEEAWPSVDTTAVVGAVIGALGLVFVAVLVLRQLRDTSPAALIDGPEPPALDDLESADETV